MKRFYFGDEENEDEEFLDDSNFIFPDPSEFITMAQFGTPDNQVLNCSIKICEKSWFWNFYKVSTKMKMIEEVFERLKILTEGQKNA